MVHFQNRSLFTLQIGDMQYSSISFMNVNSTSVLKLFERIWHKMLLAEASRGSSNIGREAVYSALFFIEQIFLGFRFSLKYVRVPMVTLAASSMSHRSGCNFAWTDNICFYAMKIKVEWMYHFKDKVLRAKVSIALGVQSTLLILVPHKCWMRVLYDNMTSFQKEL